MAAQVALASATSLVMFLAISLAAVAGGVSVARSAARICATRLRSILSKRCAEQRRKSVFRLWCRVKTCDGSGAKKGSTPLTCGTCNGVGQVRMQQGFFAVQQTCPNCRGTGTIISDPCNDCHGQGRVEETKTLSVKVPPGVDTGDRIRLSGEGEASPDGGPAGDLYVQMSVRPHPIFQARWQAPSLRSAHWFCRRGTRWRVGRAPPLMAV